MSERTPGDGSLPPEAAPIVVESPMHGDADTDTDASVDASASAILRGVVITTAPDEPAAVAREASRGEAPPKRAFSLDALRGLFLISMTLGFTIAEGVFPAWMYHRQTPGAEVVDIAGISWRDLAYGAFLFTMAAALPLTLSRLVEKGATEFQIIWAAIRRYAVLLFFALMVAHSNTYFLGYTQTARALAVVGFVLMALVFTRRRSDWNPARYAVINRAGWVLSIAFLLVSPLAYGKTFTFERIDDIIAGLAFASAAGSLIWYATRNHLEARVGAMAVAVALYLGARNDGWVQQWWYTSPFDWAFVPSRFALLMVVIPGTIAGDLVLRWMRAPDLPTDTGEAAPVPWTSVRVAGLAVLTAAFTPLVVAGLYNRASLLTAQLSLGLIAGGVALTWAPTTPVERLLRSLFSWGSFWLMLGLLVEPFEGGIKKVPETISYYFVIAGLVTLLLGALTALIDVLGKKRWVSALIDVGHNPLLCYVLFTVLLNSLLEMIPPARGMLRGSAAEALLRSGLELTAVILIVRAMSRRRIYWRT